MREKRTLSVLCAVVLLMLAIAGCSAPNQADTDAVNAAMDKFRACKSFTLVQQTEIEESVTVEGIEYVYSGLTEMEMSLITEPSLQMKTVTSVNQVYDGEQMQQSAVSYIIPENGGYAEYFSNGLEWYKLSTEAGVSLMEIGPSAVADTFFIDSVAFRKVAEETLEGGKALRYEGKLEDEELLAMLETNGLLSSISSMSENQQAKIRENLVKDLSAVTVSIWVDSVSGYPVRFEASMAQTLKELGESISKTLGNKASDEEEEIAKYAICMSLSDFDAVEDLVLPPEAASALPYEAGEVTGSRETRTSISA